MESCCLIYSVTSGVDMYDIKLKYTMNINIQNPEYSENYMVMH